MSITEKFRIWHIADEEYLDPDYYEICFISPDGELHIGMHVWSGIQDEFQTIPQSDVIIERCIGLADRNGTLIYEGDLLGDSENDEALFEVCWSPGLASFMLDEYPPEEASGNLHAIFEESLNKMVVVDNIHGMDKKREEEQD